MTSSLLPRCLATAMLLAALTPLQAQQLADPPPVGALGDSVQGQRGGATLSGEQRDDWDAALTSDGERPLASRSMVWLGRGERARLRVGLGVEQLRRSNLPSQPLQQGEIWGGVNLALGGPLSWSIETPLWVRDENRRSGLRFERPGKDGMASLRNALRFKLGPQSQLIVKPRRSRFSITYTAAW
jgi:hypothetical protein